MLTKLLFQTLFGFKPKRRLSASKTGKKVAKKSASKAGKKVVKKSNKVGTRMIKGVKRTVYKGKNGGKFYKKADGRKVYFGPAMALAVQVMSAKAIEGAGYTVGYKAANVGVSMLKKAIKKNKKTVAMGRKKIVAGKKRTVYKTATGSKYYKSTKGNKVYFGRRSCDAKCQMDRAMKKQQKEAEKKKQKEADAYKKKQEEAEAYKKKATKNILKIADAAVAEADAAGNGVDIKAAEKVAEAAKVAVVNANNEAELANKLLADANKKMIADANKKMLADAKNKILTDKGATDIKKVIEKSVKSTGVAINAIKAANKVTPHTHKFNDLINQIIKTGASSKSLPRLVKHLGSSPEAETVAMLQDTSNEIMSNGQKILNNLKTDVSTDVITSFKNKPKMTNRRNFKNKPKMTNRRNFKNKPKMTNRRNFKNKPKMTNRRNFKNKPKMTNRRNFKNKPKMTRNTRFGNHGYSNLNSMMGPTRVMFASSIPGGL
jgi:hypothetical protein